MIVIPYSSVMNMEKGNFTNFQNSYKFNEKATTTSIMFSQWWSENLYSENNWGGG